MENITQEAFTDCESSMSMSGKLIFNLRLADVIDIMAGSTKEHQDFSTRVERSSSTYGMRIRIPNSKGMMNSTKRGAKTAISIDGNLLGYVNY